MNLTRLRRRAALGAWIAKLVRAVAPAGFILAAYCAAALFGLGSAYVFPAVLLLALLALAWGLARLRRPAEEAIDRRIEQQSGLRHRPIAMLEDSPENDAPLAAAIWRLHQRRVADSLQGARAGGPAIDAAASDPFALRGLLLLLLLVGAAIAGPSGLPRLADAFAFPAWPFAGPGIDAWITFPCYAGAPPLLLAPGDHPTVLAGSRLTVIVNGAASRPAAALQGGTIGFGSLAPDSFRADVTLNKSIRLRVGSWWNPLAVWNLTVVPPVRPAVSLRQPLAVDQRLVIGWQARDRYGLASLAAMLMPVGHPRAAPESLDLLLSDPGSRNAGGVARLDVGDSPYAGSEVMVTLAARSLSGLTGAAGPMRVRLPPANLQDKTAAGLAALRQRIALDPKNARQVGDALRRLAQAPPSPISAAADLQMAFLARQLSEGETAAEAAQQRLDVLARQIEEGPDYGPAQALAAANQALEQALRQAIAAGGPMDDARLRQLLAAMHAALARHLQALGRAAAMPGGASVDTGDLDRLAEQIASDEAAGQGGKAAAELNHLEQMLAALQSARPMTAAQARLAEASDQAARDLAGMTQGESRLLDQTNQGAASAGSQAALQNQLAATRLGLNKARIALPGLSDAATAMAAAHAALQGQEIGAAATAEGGAIQALQKAAAALAASTQGMSFGESPSAGAGGYDDGDGIGGAPDEESIPGILPSGDNPAGAIQRQIIKNDSDPSLPAAAHQYYRRLLNQDAP